MYTLVPIPHTQFNVCILKNDDDTSISIVVLFSKNTQAKDLCFSQ